MTSPPDPTARPSATVPPWPHCGHGADPAGSPTGCPGRRADPYAACLAHLGIGASDTDGVGKLRVSIHHNVWKGIVQRAPLARIGQIHLYNNFYDTTDLHGYVLQYSVNARAKAQVVAEDNYWRIPASQKTSKLFSGDGTGSIAGGGNLVNGTATDLVAAYNAAHSKKLKTTVNWTPTLTAGLQTSAKNLPTELATTTGAGVLS